MDPPVLPGGRRGRRGPLAGSPRGPQPAGRGSGALLTPLPDHGWRPEVDPLPEAGWSFPGCPGPPAWRLDWAELEARYRRWLAPLEGCPQDPVHHAEGDVGIHTRMVCEELVDLPRFRALPETARAVVFAAALLHDLGKPDRTGREGGRLHARGHSLRGATLARDLLVSGAAGRPPPLALREQVVGMVLHHGVPAWTLEREDPFRVLAATSLTVRLDWLALVAEADMRGRRAADRHDLIERVELFRELAAEEGCLDRPVPFASDHSRVAYFRGGGPARPREVFDDTRQPVVMLAGLPGAGKDTWMTQHAGDLPRISLDALRAELGARASGDQGRVVARARERARELLRAGRGLLWNATNTSRRLRAGLLELFLGYGARVRVVYLDAPLPELVERNSRRPAPVPKAALERLAERLEVPDPTEAHEVEWIDTAASPTR